MELETALLTRRSVRSFTGEPIPENMLDEVLLAGILAPSSRNFQSSQFIVVREPAALEALSRAKAGGSMIVKAGCAVVVIGNSARSDAWIEDCSISMTQMMLRANDLGLGSCWIHCRNRTSMVDGMTSPDYVADLCASLTASLCWPFWRWVSLTVLQILTRRAQQTAAEFTQNHFNKSLARIDSGRDFIIQFHMASQ